MSQSIAGNSLMAFVWASRLKTLGATACPVFLGSALAKAEGTFSWALFFLTLTCSLLLQVLSNWVNDYGDFIRGADSNMRLGPKRVMQQGLISLKVMRNGIIYLILAIVLLGLSLIFLVGLPILWIGLISIFLSCWYTMGNKPLSYLGFAEVAVFLVFGPVATMGAFYVQAIDISEASLWASLTPGFLTAALLLANNLRDFNEDQKNNKRTLAVRFGDRFARIVIVALIFLSALGPILVSSIYGYLTLFGLLPLLLPIRHIPMILNDPISSHFNLMLQSIGQALYLMGFLFSFGILCGTFGL